ncbi:tetratricopeptide repeat protein [Peribacillus alkalitolerans]|uniref:tetratricopeptide repeat protein n=1 Tax=Peribacillus alkalitolerans TaxID=1550385 RepID=UPI001F07D96C|nr:tetratricopeptide repeat protein [Peribacillus alkalitolerans]
MVGNVYLWMALIVVGILLVQSVYKKKRPLTKYKHFRDRAFDLEMKKNYHEAIEVKQQALQLNTLSNLERADLNFNIGGTYLTLGDYGKAASYFDMAFDLAKTEKYPYDKQYERVIDAYVQAGRKEDAIALVDQLLERQSYDKGFRKLKAVKEELIS